MGTADTPKLCGACGLLHPSTAPCTGTGGPLGQPPPTPEARVTWKCPHCGRPLMSGDEMCGGAFTDADHPANVRAVLSSWDRPAPTDEETNGG